MARVLDVYLLQRHCGQLTQENTGQITFAYSPDWLADDKAMPLSLSLPLRSEPYTQRESAGFFGGILPEQSQRDSVAKNLGISKSNDFAMLEQIGGECAGAVTFIPAGTALPVSEHHYRPLAPHELAAAIRQLPSRPLLAGDEGIRLSLAGAQSKLAVCVDGSEISIPLGGAASTHILKPAIPQYQDIVENEAFCMSLAQKIGLDAANVEVRRVEDLDYLLIERYDRHVTQSKDGKQTIQRLHQEDFCQALGIVSTMKYQNEGGPSFRDSFELIRRVSSAPVLDLQALLTGAIFNFLIGNHDAHGKNFSLIYRETTSGVQTRLAPFYDLICTFSYPDLSKRMAMKVGKEYDSSKVLASDFERFAEDVGLSKSLTLRRITEVADQLLSKLPEVTLYPAAGTVSQLIQIRCKRIREKFPR